MNYDYSEKEFTFFIDIYEMLKTFAADHPMDAAGDAASKNIGEAVAKLARTPYLKLALEETDGLSGMTSLMGAMETVAAVSPSLYLSVEYSTRVLGRALAQWATADQKKKWLNPLFDGVCLGALALCEETVNVDNDPLATSGKTEGGNIVVNGRKQFVVNAPRAAFFGVVGLFEDKPAMFMVPKDAPGLVMDEPVESFGYTGVAISAIRMENCTISSDDVIVPGGKIDLRATLRFWENQVLLGASLGLIKSAFETARDFAKTHKTGGKPIIAYQEIGFKLAEMLTLHQSAQLLAIRSAWTAENEPKEADTLTLCAKVFCTEAAEQVTSDALKILGSSAYFGSNDVERAYRCAKYGQIFGTSTELSRVKIGDAALAARN